MFDPDFEALLIKLKQESKKMIKKPWKTAELQKVNLSQLGYKEINTLEASRKFVEKINIFIKFYYHDMNSKKLIESPLYFLDKEILKDRKILKYSAFEHLFMQLKIKEIFPHTVMSFFIYTDNRTTMPKDFVKEIKQLALNFN